MKKSPLLPRSPVSAVRADTTISDCVKIMRDKSIGALVITSANVKEEIVGIFTERDLVKEFELIHKGGFWDNPVRSVMTSVVRTITVDKVEDAPRIMAKYNIRHLPVVSVEKGRTYLVGVVSMRDIFRIAMEKLDYDLSRISPPTPPGVKPRTGRKLVGVFTEDKALRELVDKTTKLTGHMLVKGLTFKTEGESILGHLEKFDALFIDLEKMSPVESAELLAQAKAIPAQKAVFIAFNPVLENENNKASLHKLSDRKQIHLFAKPIAFGLFYEKFLNVI